MLWTEWPLPREGFSSRECLTFLYRFSNPNDVCDSDVRTTNHLEKLDPALSRPGRMDVWVEFKNASRWQAEALFRNFFPCSSPDPLIDPEDDDEFDERELDGIHIPMTSSSSYDNTGSPTSSIWTSSPLTSSKGKGKAPPRSPTASTPPPQFGASNQAYLPPPVAPEILAATLGPNGLRKPLDGKTLAMLAKNYADAIPEGEFSVAALQGCESFTLVPFSFLC